MNLTKQPPRRPSNTNMAGIVGLARMTDKARAYNNKRLGEYLYGGDSGLDVAVLEFINMTPDEYANAAGEMNDTGLSPLVLKKARKSPEEIAAFNKAKLEETPKDERHRQLLKDRVKKYAPERTDVKTVFQSMELDDWGNFRDKDLTKGPPRSPYVRSVAGIVGVARMGDKARAAKAGLPGEYKYGTASPLDRIILKSLDINADDFAHAAYQHPNDIELGEWIRANINKSGAEISAFNARRIMAGRSGEYRNHLLGWRSQLCPERTDLNTFFELMDYADEHRFGLVDLTRHAPRSPYDTSVGGLTALGRMIDKGRAYNGGTLSDYWYGEDCVIDRCLLEFLDVDQDEFATALTEHNTDEAVVEWLGERLNRPQREIEEFNQKRCNFSPTHEEQHALLNRMVSKYEPYRVGLESLFALIALDDAITFASMKAGS